MLKRILPILLGIAMMLTACGPQGTPTMAPADVQNTAVAAAWTMVAATQQAIPTATPLPPTETPSPTPLPTFTPLALPSLSQTVPTATKAAAAGDCLGPLNMGEAGPTVKVRIENQAGGPLTISLNLYTKNAFGQCGALSYTLGKNEKKTVSLPKGFWWAYAWITLGGGTSSTASCSFELRVGDEDLIRLLVSKESCRDVGA